MRRRCATPSFPMPPDMSTPSESDSLPADLARRLHPLSWMFVLLQQLRSYAIPLIVLLVTGRGSTSEWYGLIGVAVLTIVSVVQYFSYRYEPGPDGLIVRSGVLQRTIRDIPYDRIHTVNLHQSLLHRACNVTEVRLESAGSKEPEAVMRVLSLADARALEELIQARGGAQRRAADGPTGAVASDESVGDTLLALRTADIVRLGLISNRGMVVVATVAGLAWQISFESQGYVSPGAVPEPLLGFYRTTWEIVASRLDDTAALTVGVLLLIATALVLVRALSILLALLQFHGFTLAEVDRQLRVQRGLLTRVRHQLPRRRIQAWRVDESLLHRWFRRQTLRVDSAAGADDERSVRDLAPVATPDVVRTLVQRFLPHVTWPPEPWSPVHPLAWRRLVVRPALVVGAMTAAGAWFYDGRVLLLLLVLLPAIVLRARRLAGFAGYRMAVQVVAVRAGWLNRAWGLAEIAKLQSIRLTQSPFDRRLGMATLWLDTAGASTADGVLRIRYLPVEEAGRLYANLAGRMKTMP